MATFTKTLSGKYKATIRRSGWPTVCKSFRTRRDAEDWARRTEDEMVRGVYIQRSTAERLTVAAALERYLAEVTPTKKALTRRAEITKAKQLVGRLGKYSLAALTPDVVAGYRDKRLEEGKAANTVRLELALLSHLYTVAIQEWRVGLVYNPVQQIRRPSPGQGRERRLAPDEEVALIAAAEAHSNPMFGWAVKLALHTAMRSNELLTLTRDQVDLRRGVVRLSDTKNGSSRTVPLSPPARAIFQEALDYPIRPIDCNLIFFGEPGKDGKRRPYQFSKLWADTLKKQGIVDLHFHDLRHEAVSRLVEAGLADQEVASISGHKSMQMLRRYTHLRAEDLVAKLEKAIRR
ncbi:MAG: site-specific integrase [Sulfuricella sp.]|nr:site-specific integrase [Sulfuricella sp.]